MYKRQFLGLSSGVSKLSLKSDTNSLLWDGTNLNINGGGTFSGNLSAASGTFSGTLSASGGTFTGSLSGGTISIGSGNSIFKADSNGIYLGNATFASAPFSVTPAGVLKSTSGTIGGWTLGATTLTGGSATLNSAGSISIGSGNSIFKADSNGIYLGNATFASAPFSVTPAGSLIASIGSFGGILQAATGDFTGSITAQEGRIGGWRIEAGRLFSVSGSNNASIVNLNSSGNGSIVINSAVTANQPVVLINGGQSFADYATAATLSNTTLYADGNALISVSITGGPITHRKGNGGEGTGNVGLGLTTFNVVSGKSYNVKVTELALSLIHI